MRYRSSGIFAFAAMLAGLACNVQAAGTATQKAEKKTIKAYVVVFDFFCRENADIGRQVSDSVRLRLARHEDFDLIDRLTTQEMSAPLPLETAKDKVIELMRNKFGATVGFYGTVSKTGQAVRADIRCIDLTDPDKVKDWTKTFSNDTERARGEIAKELVEGLTGLAEWKPPEVGDEPEPKSFGKPLDLNGDFEQGSAHWDPPDNVSTFIIDGPTGRGKILKVRTDLARDPWLEYTRNLRLGLADPSRPPKIARDTSYGSVAGLEGVHYRGEWIKATPGQRYWMVADHKGPGGAKVFVKGFQKTEWALDGLPESSLVALKMSPEQFAKLPLEQRKKLIEEDSKKNPMRYVRECYRWYLNCGASGNQWTHFALPVPPRGGLPKNVEWIQIQVYSYWPPGEYLWDNVFLYKDPAQAAPLPEEPARTPNYGKTSDVIERMTSRPATNPADRKP